jgi:hypothetical protein
VWSSVIEYQEQVKGAANDPGEAAPVGATGVAGEAVDLLAAYGRLAMAYGRLSQAAQAHVDAGWTGRRRTREDLRQAVQDGAEIMVSAEGSSVAAGEIPGQAPPSLPEGREGQEAAP